jgi:hypothetical protein
LFANAVNTALAPLGKPDVTARFTVPLNRFSGVTVMLVAAVPPGTALSDAEDAKAKVWAGAKTPTS